MSSAQAGSDAHSSALTLLWPQSEVAQVARDHIQASGLAETIITLMQQRLAVSAPLTVVLGGAGKPRIGERGQLVSVPYEHLQQIQAHLYNNRSAEPELLQVALDAYSYSVVHQLAHVLIQQDDSDQWLGEDAVADLSMLTLIEHVPDGGRIARNALQLFDRHAVGMVRPRDNYWAAHALNAERYWAGVCQLMGSGHAVDDVISAVERFGGSSCEQHYAMLKNSWQQVFVANLPPIGSDTSVASR